jgi:hypothetical protein
VRSVSQEIPRLLRNPTVHYCVHKSPPPIPVLSQMNPIRTLQIWFLKVHFNITLPFMFKSFECSFSFMHSSQNFVSISHLPLCADHSDRLIPIDMITLIISGWVEIMELLVMAFFRPPVSLSLLRPDIFVSTRFSDTLRIPFSLSWWGSEEEY